ncbi:MAG: leucine-rich repeat domain-containing protein [Candidatus Lokiarchaeota archaeon]|nr:leucine-rich repeat domain-containing protein [Candidatus Lokiarchaeota archaeon]
MVSYKITKLIELVLEEQMDFRVDEKRLRTNIYVNGMPFRQCMTLILHIPKNSLERETFESIDEYEDKYAEFNLHNKDNLLQITPEEEFWAHCSNLQAWVEHDYDTNLLHSNLSFPLLEELSKYNDKKAYKVFREEIGKKIQKRYFPIISLLYDEGYVDYLSREEFWSLFPFDSRPLQEIEDILGEAFILYEPSKLLFYGYDRIERVMGFCVEDDEITEVGFSHVEYPYYPKIIWDTILGKLSRLPKLRHLRFDQCNLTGIPLQLNNLKTLEKLDLSNNHLEIKNDRMLRSLLLIRRLKEVTLGGVSAISHESDVVRKLKEKGVKVNL